MAEAVMRIDATSWLVGGVLVLEKKPSATEYLWKDDSDGWYYTLSEARVPAPQASPIPPNDPIQVVRKAGDSTVWSFGDAFLKIKRILSSAQAATKEHKTLSWLGERELSFAIPKVLGRRQHADHQYLFISRVAGSPLGDIWRNLDETQQQRYVGRIADVCRELSAWTSTAITGVDGAHVADRWLDPLPRGQYDFSPETLRKNCVGLGMECSTLVFSHGDLGPSNVIVDVETDRIGIIDWEHAGFVPRGWVRTKFMVSYGLDFEWDDVDSDDPSLRAWRDAVALALGEAGFPEVQEKYKDWWHSRRAALVSS